MANPERALLKSAYPSSRQWAEKVDNMTKAQVVAITLRLKMQNKL